MTCALLDSSAVLFRFFGGLDHGAFQDWVVKNKKRWASSSPPLLPPCASPLPGIFSLHGCAKVKGEILSALTEAELLACIANLRKFPSLPGSWALAVDSLESYLNVMREAGQIVPFDEVAARVYGALRQSLLAQNLTSSKAEREQNKSLHEGRKWAWLLQAQALSLDCSVQAMPDVDKRGTYAWLRLGFGGKGEQRLKMRAVIEAKAAQLVVPPFLRQTAPERRVSFALAGQVISHVIDTNVLYSLQSLPALLPVATGAKQQALECLLNPARRKEIGVPALVLAELLGNAHMSDQQRQEALDFVAQATLLAFDSACAAAQQAIAWRVHPTDAAVGATALGAGATLLTNDALLKRAIKAALSL